MKYQVYALYDKRNDEIGYIGATTLRLCERIKKHRSGHHEKSSRIFVERIGKENLGIKLIEECSSEEEMYTREVYWTNYYRTKYSLVNINTGRIIAKETRKKISDAQKGEKHHWYGKNRPEETKLKMRKSNPNCKEVLCIETQTFYPSISEAARQTGINVNGIFHACHGKYHTAGGYHWTFVEEED